MTGLNTFRYLRIREQLWGAAILIRMVRSGHKIHCLLSWKKNLYSRRNILKNIRKPFTEVLSGSRIKKQERIIYENNSFVVLVPFWAAWPFETMIISKRSVQYISEFTTSEKTDLAQSAKSFNGKIR